MQRDRTGVASAMRAVAMLTCTFGLAASFFVLSGCGSRGDPVHGREVYAQCVACHALKTHLVGPKHCGVFGRRAGSLPDYEYSETMTELGVVWNEETLDEFLAAPLTYVSGTTMGSVGVHDERDRADVIAYLREISSDPAQCGS